MTETSKEACCGVGDEGGGGGEGKGGGDVGSREGGEERERETMEENLLGRHCPPRSILPSSPPRY